MKCSGCGKESWVIRTVFREGNMFESCRECGNLSTPWIPDAYFKEPYLEEHFGDEKHPNGRFVHSKRHKVQMMREMGIHESGDRVHGARNEGHFGWGCGLDA